MYCTGLFAFSLWTLIWVVLCSLYLSPFDWVGKNAFFKIFTPQFNPYHLHATLDSSCDPGVWETAIIDTVMDVFQVRLKFYAVLSFGPKYFLQTVDPVSCTSSLLVASNDDIDYDGFNYLSAVDFCQIPSSASYIRVSSYGGDYGDFKLEVFYTTNYGCLNSSPCDSVALPDGLHFIDIPQAALTYDPRNSGVVCLNDVGISETSGVGGSWFSYSAPEGYELMLWSIPDSSSTSRIADFV